MPGILNINFKKLYNTAEYLQFDMTCKPCKFLVGTSLFSHQRGYARRFHTTMYGFIRMLAKAAVWAALVRLFNWLMDEFLS